MKVYQPKLFLLLIFSLSFFSCGSSGGGGESTQELLRVVHAAPTLGKITILENGRPVVGGISYGAASDYQEIDESTKAVFSIRVDPEFVIPVLSVEEDVTGPYKKTLLVTEAAGQPVFTFIADLTTTPVASDESRIRFVNAASSASSLDVYVTGVSTSLTNRTPAVAGLAFKKVSSFFPAAPGDFRIRIAVSAGSTTGSSSSSATASSAASSSASSGSSSSASTAPDISFDLKLFPIGSEEEITFFLLEDQGGGTPYRHLAVISE